MDDNLSGYNTTPLPQECIKVQFEPLYDWAYVYAVSIISSLVILSTIIGNVFVIAAIVMERNLHRVSNYLIISLAIADLMVAIIVMPISTIHTVSKTWWMGIEVCDFFVVMDVCCCTASIMHLVAIAFDRYWAITRVDYLRRRTSRPIFIMVFVVWTITIALAVPSRFSINRNPDIIQDFCSGNCRVNQSTIFTIFSVGIAFYLPMVVLLIIYAKIYQAARSRIRRKRFNPQRKNLPSTSSFSNTTRLIESTDLIQKPKLSSPNHTSNGNNPEIDSKFNSSMDNLIFPEPLPVDDLLTGLRSLGLNDSETSSMENTETCQVNTSPWKRKDDMGRIISYNERIFGGTDPSRTFYYSCTRNDREKRVCIQVDQTKNSTTEKIGERDQQQSNNNDKISNTNDFTIRRKNNEIFKSILASKESINTTELKERLEHRREKKAARTLAIITGCFVGCWLPYSLYVLIVPVCSTCSGHRLVFDSLNWLGYFNSLLNPIIYTIFSPDFRNAFKKFIYAKYTIKSNQI